MIDRTGFQTAQVVPPTRWFSHHQSTHPAWSHLYRHSDDDRQSIDPALAATATRRCLAENNRARDSLTRKMRHTGISMQGL